MHQREALQSIIGKDPSTIIDDAWSDLPLTWFNKLLDRNNSVLEDFSLVYLKKRVERLNQGLDFFSMNKLFHHVVLIKTATKTMTTIYQSNSTTDINGAHYDRIVVDNMLDIAIQELREMSAQMCKFFKSSGKDG